MTPTRPSTDGTGEPGGGPDEAPRRPVRMLRGELKVLLLDAGADILRERGLSTGLDTLSFPEVFAEVERRTGRRVTRGSVYDRIWLSLEAYQWDVLRQVVEQAARSQRDTTIGRLRRVLPKLETGSDTARWGAVRSLANTVAEPFVADGSRTVEQRIIRGTTVLVSPAADLTPHEAVDARAALTRHLGFEAAWHEAAMRVVARHVGLRMRAPVELARLVQSFGALADGLTARRDLSPDYRSRFVRAPLHGEDANSQGTVVALAVESLVASMVELDPDWPGPLPAPELDAALRAIALDPASAEP